MPQTDHVMVTLPKSPSGHQLKLAHGVNSPAVSQKSYHSNCPSTHNSCIKAKPIEVQKKSNHKDSKDEKNSDFSFGWELQLSALVFIFFVVGLAVPVAMAVIGGVYLFSCPRNIMIPVFLIVCGSTFLLSVFGLRKLSSRRITEQDHLCYKVCLRSSILFQMAWFTAGCFWIYGAYEPNYNSDVDENYCNKSLYLFAFWLLNSIFLVLGALTVAFVTFLICGRQTQASPVSV